MMPRGSEKEDPAPPSEKTPHRQEILDLFRKPKVVDTEVHALADQLKIPHDQLEGEIYEILRQNLSEE